MPNSIIRIENINLICITCIECLKHNTNIRNKKIEINLCQTQFCYYIVSNEIDSDGKILLNWVICTPSHLQHNHSLGHVFNPANASILFERMQLFLQCKQSIYHFCLFALINGRLISIHMQLFHQAPTWFEFSLFFLCVWKDLS